MITKANAEAFAVRQKLRDQVSEASLSPADTSLVMFGSLARGEWTQQSDLDWALMVDGGVDGNHAAVARQIADLFATLGYPKPGPTDVFGGLMLATTSFMSSAAKRTPTRTRHAGFCSFSNRPVWETTRSDRA
jgi:predicted nucleotidyltransferase